MQELLKNPTFYIITSHLDIIKRAVDETLNTSTSNLSKQIPPPHPISNSLKDIIKSNEDYFETLSTTITNQKATLSHGKNVIKKLDDLLSALKQIDLIETSNLESTSATANEVIDKIITSETELYEQYISKNTNQKKQTDKLKSLEEKKSFWEQKRFTQINLDSNIEQTLHPGSRLSGDLSKLTPISQLNTRKHSSSVSHGGQNPQLGVSQESSTTNSNPVSDVQKHKKRRSISIFADGKITIEAPQDKKTKRLSTRLGRSVITEKPKELVVEETLGDNENPKEVVEDPTLNIIEKYSNRLEDWCSCSNYKVLYDSFSLNESDSLNKVVQNLSYLYFITETEGNIFGCFVQKPIEAIDRPVSDPTHFIFSLPATLNENTEPKKYFPKDDNWKHSFTLMNGDEFLYKVNVGGCMEISKPGEPLSRCVNLSSTYSGIDDSTLSGHNKKKFSVKRVVVLQMY
ncbi:hypothetical protein QTN25_008602 [Entamoeba marina]